MDSKFILQTMLRMTWIICPTVLLSQLIPILVPVIISALGEALPIVAKFVTVSVLLFVWIASILLLVWCTECFHNQMQTHQLRRRLQAWELRHRMEQEPPSVPGPSHNAHTVPPRRVVQRRQPPQVRI